jgi:type II secretory ATPase GspE/PulE/Tfp pilus assembly ATPase PilB-like protein
MVELVRDSLRMRPDRVVVGEVRKADEAKAYAESALSGQAKGSYATFHAQSSRDAVNRLRMMGCQPTDMEGIGVFVVQRRVSIYDSKKRKCGEERRVTEIAIGGVDDAMRPIQVYYEGKYSQQGMAMLLARISAGTGMALKEAVLEMKRREGFFLRFKGKKAPKSEEAFKLIQTFMYGGGE